MKLRLISLITALTLCGYVHAQNADWEAAKKEAIDATRYNPDAIDAATVSDLDFDPAFGVLAGKAVYDFNAGAYTRDWGMRTFNRNEVVGDLGGGLFIYDTFRYAVGVQWQNGTWAVAVARTNAGVVVNHPGTPFASGKVTLATTLTEVQDVAFDGSHRLYFTGQSNLLFFGKAFTTFCFDIDTGAACAGFASGSVTGYSYTVFDVPGGDANRLGSIARRIIYDVYGHLIIGGESNLAVGTQVALTEIDAVTGQTVTAFGINGTITFQVNGSTDQRLFDLAERPRLTDGPYYLYVAGTFQVSGSDYDGYITAINLTNGNVVDTVSAYDETDNTGFKKDAVTAITFLANGKLAFAGNSETDNPSVPSLLLGRLDLPNGLVYDEGFCGSGLCTYSNLGFPGSFSHAVPTAIAERPGNRDLVVAMQGNSVAIGTPQVIRIEQYSSSGAYRTSQEISVPGAGPTTTWAGAGLEVDDRFVTVIGTRLWGPALGGDVDFVVAHLKANDSIFADTFGGSLSD